MRLINYYEKKSPLSNFPKYSFDVLMISPEPWFKLQNKFKNLHSIDCLKLNSEKAKTILKNGGKKPLFHSEGISTRASLREGVFGLFGDGFRGQVLLISPELLDFCFRKANLKITRLRMRVTTHRIMFDLEGKSFLFLINLENITELKSRVIFNHIFLKNLKIHFSVSLKKCCQKTGIFSKVISEIELVLSTGARAVITGKSLEDPFLNIQAVLEKREFA